MLWNNLYAITFLFHRQTMVAPPSGWWALTFMRPKLKEISKIQNVLKHVTPIKNVSLFNNIHLGQSPLTLVSKIPSCSFYVTMHFNKKRIFLFKKIKAWLLVCIEHHATHFGSVIMLKCTLVEINFYFFLFDVKPAFLCNHSLLQWQKLRFIGNNEPFWLSTNIFIVGRAWVES